MLTESKLVKMPNCWKSHVKPHILCFQRRLMENYVPQPWNVW